MNRSQLEATALAAADRCLKGKGHIALVDVFIEMGKLTRQSLEDWRMGRTPCLERGIQANLSQINAICRAIHRSAARGKLKPSRTVYAQWGKGKGAPLRFTKSGDPHLERQWATHYLHPQKAKRATPCEPAPGVEKQKAKSTSSPASE